MDMSENESSGTGPRPDYEELYGITGPLAAAGGGIAIRLFGEKFAAALGCLYSLLSSAEYPGFFENRVSLRSSCFQDYKNFQWLFIESFLALEAWPLLLDEPTPETVQSRIRLAINSNSSTFGGIRRTCPSRFLERVNIARPGLLSEEESAVYLAVFLEKNRFRYAYYDGGAKEERKSREMMQAALAALGYLTRFFEKGVGPLISRHEPAVRLVEEFMQEAPSCLKKRRQNIRGGWRAGLPAYFTIVRETLAGLAQNQDD